MKIFPSISALLLLVATGAAAEQFYKWKDAEGVWHYTSTPPPAGTQAQNVKVAKDRATASVASTDPAAQATPTPTAGEMSDGQRLNCEEARNTVSMIESSPYVNMDKDGDGRPELLPDADREKELERARLQAKLYCGES